MYRKVSGIIIILLIAAGISITATRCYDDKNEARVTIHLERNDLAAMGIQPEKHFIDRVLEFFSTPAEAMTSSPWTSTNRTASCAVTLYVFSPSFEDQTYSIPYNATESTVIIPSSANTTITVISSISGNKNWGGQTTVDLTPGDQDITIKMIPMTRVGFHMSNITLDLAIDDFELTQPTNTSSVNIYRSTIINGQYTKIATIGASGSDLIYQNSGVVSGTTYHYKVSVSGSDGEGVLSDPYTVNYIYP